MAELGSGDLERYKAEYAALGQQIATMTERHVALGKIISGLETLLRPAVLAAKDAVTERRLELHPQRSHLANAVLVLRYYRRHLTATEIAKTFAAHGITIKPNTLYKALRRRGANGHVVPHFPGFGLAEWEKIV
jgi:hypothetical protein